MIFGTASPDDTDQWPNDSSTTANYPLRFVTCFLNQWLIIFSEAHQPPALLNLLLLKIV